MPSPAWEPPRREPGPAAVSTLQPEAGPPHSVAPLHLPSPGLCTRGLPLPPAHDPRLRPSTLSNQSGILTRSVAAAAHWPLCNNCFLCVDIWLPRCKPHLSYPPRRWNA
ncbi:hypothetical protein J1614_004203 [Plenodomus biglobosus]|nr:hypothetical protein J1614_004203 [Plenodomus biglobosus]